MNGLALFCSHDGVVQSFHVVGAGVGVVEPRTGIPFPALFGHGEVGRALNLFAALGRDGMVIDWPLDAPWEAPGRAATLYVSGVRSADGIALMAALRPGAVAELREALRGVSPELAWRLDALTVRNAAEAASQAALFEEMSILNSELATAQRALAKANADLAQSNEMKNRLLGMLAHDLRTPLQVIAGFAQHLKDRLGPRLEEADLACIERIRESSLFMRHLVEDALSLSAVQAGKLHIARRPVDLGTLVRRNVAINGVIARGKDMAIDLEVADGLPPVSLDPGKMEQVMNNLLSNAIKYSDRGNSVLVSVGRDGDHARIAVTDHGHGMPQQDAGRLFQPFARCAPFGTAGESSVGLGLFICRSIVEAHGGRIGVVSAPGEGSTFTVELPLGEGGPPPLSAARSPAA